MLKARFTSGKLNPRKKSHQGARGRGCRRDFALSIRRSFQDILADEQKGLSLEEFYFYLFVWSCVFLTSSPLVSPHTYSGITTKVLWVQAKGSVVFVFVCLVAVSGVNGHTVSL